jgi:hypothetical protein
MGNKNTHNCRTPGTREKNTTTHSQLLPPVLNLQLQIHSECPKKQKNHPQLQKSRDKEIKTPTTAEIQQPAQGKKHNTSFQLLSSKKE